MVKNRTSDTVSVLNFNINAIPVRYSFPPGFKTFFQFPYPRSKVETVVKIMSFRQPMLYIRPSFNEDPDPAFEPDADPDSGN
jgi:hypothetical protein